MEPVSSITTTGDARSVRSGLPKAKGILSYDRSGPRAGSYSRRAHREMLPWCREAQRVKGTEDTAQTPPTPTYSGYDDYLGTYTVNEKEGTVTNSPLKTPIPGDIGGPQKRALSAFRDLGGYADDQVQHDAATTAHR